MGFFTRDRSEKVVEYHSYPEAAFISNRPRLAWWYRFLLGRPMDNVRWTNSTFWHSASRGEAHRWLRLAGWQRLLVRLALTYFPLLLLAVALLWYAGQWVALANDVLFVIVVLHVMFAVIPVALLDAHLIREHGISLPVLRREQREELADEDVAPKELEAEETPRRLVLRWERVVEGRREWERKVIRPLAAAISERLDNVYRPGDTDWVRVPRNYASPGGDPVTILLPSNFGGDPAAIRGLERVIGNKLGVGDLVFEWQLAGDAPRVLALAPPAPPKVAPFATYRELLLATQEYRPFLGVVASGELLAAEMIDASPHIGLSAGTGAGKSMLLRGIIAQALRWGWFVLILDWKAESHEWAEGLDGVKIVTTVEGIHEMGERIGEEVDLRKAMTKEQRARYPRVLVVREEWNMTAALLSQYWSALRSMADPEEKRTMPVQSPGLMGFNSLDFAGRAFGLFDLLVAQRMSNRVFNGNTDTRENFMIRLLSRYTPQTWKMLIPEMKPMRKPKELGRWVVWAQDEVQQVQAILWTEEEAREFARGGVPNPPSPFAALPGLEDASPPVIEGEEVDIELDDSVETVATGRNEDHPQVLRKLSDISLTLEYLGITHAMLRKAARGDEQGDPDFPPAKGGSPQRGYLYDVREVTQWARNKRAIEAAEREVKEGGVRT